MRNSFDSPVPLCEEGVLNPLPSPRPFQKGKGCNFYAIKEIFPNHPVPPSQGGLHRFSQALFPSGDKGCNRSSLSLLTAAL